MSKIQDVVRFNPELAQFNYSCHSRETISRQEILERFSEDKLWFSGCEESSDSACEEAFSAEDVKPEPEDVPESAAGCDADDSENENSKWISLTTYNNKINLLHVTRLFVSNARNKSYVIVNPKARQQKKERKGVQIKQDAANDVSVPVDVPVPDDVSGSEPQAESQTTLLECNSCLFRTPYPETLEIHMLTHEESDKVQVEFPKPLLECDLCPFRTPYPETLTTHDLIHKEKNLHLCNLCNKRFQLASSLTRHIIKVHAKDISVDVPGSEQPHAESLTSLFECDTCLFRTPYPETLEIHMLTHKGTGSDQVQVEFLKPLLQCDVCLFSTPYPGTLKTHMRVHKEKRPCNLCNKRFDSASGLTRHMSKVHINDLSVDVSGSEQLHAETLTSVFECDNCLFRTPYPGILNTHMLLHKADKPHSCAMCTKRFQLQHKLFRHMKTVHGVDRVICEECGLVTTKNDLELHVGKIHPTKVIQTAAPSLHQGHQEASSSSTAVVPKGERRRKQIIQPKTVPEMVTPGAPTIPEANISEHSELPRAISDHTNIPETNFDDTEVPQTSSADIIEPESDHDEISETSSDRDHTDHSSIAAIPTIEIDESESDSEQRKTVNLGCNICLFRTNRLATLKAHMITHKRDYPFTCEKCSMGFARYFRLKDHLQVIHGVDRSNCRKCPKCSFVSTEERQWKLHRDSHKKRGLRRKGGRLKCKKCGYIAVRKYDLEIHKWTKHEGASFTDENLTCKLCDFRAKYLSALKIHIGYFHDGAPFQCQDCDFSTEMKPEWNKHMRTHTSGFKKFTCDLCDYSAKYLSVLKIHFNRIHDGAPFQCSACDFNTMTITEWKRHRRTCSVAAPLICYYCGFQTRHRKYLRAHISCHMRNPGKEVKKGRRRDCVIHDCPDPSCNQQFSTNRKMRSHYVHNHKEFFCESCDFRTTERKMLRKHLIKIHGIAKYECDICLRRFNHPQSWHRHKVIHTGEHPFVCTVCGRAFNQKNTMQRHMQLHDPRRHTKRGKAMKCYHCDFWTTRKQALLTHITVIHLGTRKGFQCTVCNFLTTNSTYLKKHLSNHSVSTPFMCHHCSYKVRRLHTLRNHIRANH